MQHVGSSLQHLISFLFSVAAFQLSCGMWDPVPRLGIEPRPSALGLWKLSCWTIREVPGNLKMKRLEDFPVMTTHILSWVTIKFLLIKVSLLYVRPWCWGRLKAGGEGGDRGWKGWMASPTQWIWVWENSERWWRTGKPGVLQTMRSQRVGHDWATEQKICQIGLTYIIFSVCTKPSREV